MHYSALQILKHGLTGNKGWKPVWRNPEPKKSYDIVIIGGGGHGLSTAYYLAKTHGIRNIAVLEKGYLGGGNVGRNTTIVRANYLLDGNLEFYSHSLKLWENLEQELNYNVMLSQRGCLVLAHNDAQYDALARRGNANLATGDDAVLMSTEDVRKYTPYLNFDNARFPIRGGLLQRTGGTARHDAVAWGYARGADMRGVDLIQNCEVTGFRIEGGKVKGVETSRGYIGAGKVGMSVAGRTSQLAEMAGMRLPIESHVLQAFVTEAIKPVIDSVISFGMGHFYISQSDKGGLVFGGDLDGYNSYSQRGNLPIVEHLAEAAMTLMPMLGKSRVLRGWGGIMDMSMDGSPIIDLTPIDGLFLNGGWCYGGFKAVPAAGTAFAHLMATGEKAAWASKYNLNRFEIGNLIDDEGTGARPNLH